MCLGNDNQGKFMKFGLIAAAAVAALAAPVANAALDLQVVGSVNLTSAFGLAFDGTNVWYSTQNGTIGRLNKDTMTVFGSTYGTGHWGEMAFDGTNVIVAGQNDGKLYSYSTVDGSAQGSKQLVNAPEVGLIDGLDIDGGKVYYSPDVSNIYRYDYGSATFEALLATGGGGFSGVEKVHVGTSDFLIVVNDASSPRRLCRMGLDGSFNSVSDCASLPNSRYEGLAFDGRYIYAADYYGNRIDKIDLKVDGGSIFVPPVGNIPEPETYAMMLAGLGVMGMVARRRRSA